MEASTLRRVAAIVGWQPAEVRRIQGGGYSPAERWVASRSDGASVFVKIGVTAGTADALRAEHAVYRQLRAGFMPALVGFDGSLPHPLLVLEDLSEAYWPPPWRPGDVSRVVSALGELAAVRPLPPQMPSLEVERSMLSGWTEVAAEPMPFLSLGLCSAAWLSRALPTLLRAQASAVLEGDDLVHVDVRSDNLCLLPQRVVFIDWNFARRGNAAFDLASVAPSIQMEGGPAPEELLPNAGPLACLLAGYFAARAGLPLVPDAPRVRWVQQQQLSKALPWAVRELGLPALDGVAPGA